MFTNRQRRVSNAFKATFNSLDGQIALGHLLHEIGFLLPNRAYTDKYQDGMAQALAGAFKDGERNILLLILQQLEMSEREVLTLQHMYQDHMRRLQQEDTNDETVVE